MQPTHMQPSQLALMFPTEMQTGNWEQQIQGAQNCNHDRHCDLVLERGRYTVLENFDKRDKKSTDKLPAYTLFPAKGCQVAWKSQVK
jgi:hypothetical protein